jgi:hypothetical protein
MAQGQMQGPAVKAAPQPNVYTVLLGVANAVLLVTLIVVLYNLLSSGGYGLSISNLFGSVKVPY